MSGISVDLQGRIALVTGATKGIGREVALRLADAGCDLCVTGRDQEQLATLTADIKARGRVCWARPAELARREAVLAMAEYFVASTEHIDILVNNAGTSFPETITDLDPDHWDTTLAVNLTAPALITRVVAPVMLRQKAGCIINVSSQASIAALTEHAAYCASKFGMNGLTKVLALELGPQGIRVNAVAPTVVLTPMGEQVWGDPAKGDPMKAKIPLGKFAYPADVADAVLFLASDAASMINGEVMVIDGGVYGAVIPMSAQGFVCIVPPMIRRYNPEVFAKLIPGSTLCP